MQTPRKIKQDFNDLLDELKRGYDAIDSLNVNHTSLNAIRKKFKEQLISQLKRIEQETTVVNEEIVWDHLVVGFMGETNAGKSSIIETLRLKYSVENRSWVHGSIVGTGECDFTKDSEQYDLNINGKRVTLIDIPGIEGDEAKYEHIIRKALRQAHFVFYVHPKTQPADEKISSKIKSYLADWTRVYSIWNPNYNPSYYKEPEARERFITQEIEDQEKVIHNSFELILGKKLYEGNVTVQALLALCSASDFPSHEKLRKKASKVKQYFGSAEAVFQFSNISALVEILNQSADRFETGVASSQHQKLIALKKGINESFREIFDQEKRNLEILEERLLKLKSDVKLTTERLLTEAKQKCETNISNAFLKTRQEIENSLGPKTKVNDFLSLMRYKLDQMKFSLTRDLRQDLQTIIKEYFNRLNKRFEEFQDLEIYLPHININPTISINVDTERIVKNLTVTINDVVSVVGSAISGAGIGLIFGPIGVGVGGILGGIAAILKKAVFGDRGVSKTKAKLRDELDFCKNMTLKDLEYEFDGTRQVISQASMKVQNTIQKEINNLSELQRNYDELITKFNGHYGF